MDNKEWQEKRTRWVAKNQSNLEVAKDIGVARKANVKVSDDTQMRLKIQSQIRKSVEEGISEEEILYSLQAEEKFAKYAPFFSSWIQHAINQSSKKNQRSLSFDYIESEQLKRNISRIQ